MLDNQLDIDQGKILKTNSMKSFQDIYKSERICISRKNYVANYSQTSVIRISWV